jgi:polyisoprenoid-binding protein YceI
MNDTLTHVALYLLDGAGVGQWALDESASSVTVRQKSLWGVIRGTFAEMAGEGEILADGTAVGTIRIAAASVRTGRKRRDARLRSPDLLAAHDHPQITFWLANVRLAAGSDVRVDGELEVRGVPEPISFPATITEARADAVTVTGEAAVDRRTFGMTPNRLGSLVGPATVRFDVRLTHR